MNPFEQYMSNLQTVPTEVLKIICNSSKNFLVYEKFQNIAKKDNLLMAVKYTQNNPFFNENTYEQCIKTFEEIMSTNDKER